MVKQQVGYYSFSKEKYNTPIEASEYNFIRRIFKGFVINPNKDLNTDNPYEMNININLIYKVNFMVVSATKGYIGRCSFWEVKQALLMGIPVFEIYSIRGIFKYRAVIALKKVSNVNYIKYARLVSKPIPQKIKSITKQQN